MKLSLKIWLFLIPVLVSCEAEEIPENKELEKQMIGEWRNVALKIKMNTFGNKDTFRILEVDEKNWEARMKIQPIRTFYRADGTYNAEHRNLKDSLIYNPAGRWAILDDTIIMMDTFPERALAYRYKIVIKNNMAEFTGVEDCDRDGKADDDYYGLHRKEK
jgi:hypothetical protein